MNRRFIRPLKREDFEKGFLELLSELTIAGEASFQEVTQRFREIENNDDYRIVVIEDTETHRLMASATLFVERKFVRGCGKVGHIEDVVVSKDYRGEGLGKRLILDLLEWGKQQGCYKVILDCTEENIAFYERCGMQRKEIQMVKYF